MTSRTKGDRMAYAKDYLGCDTPKLGFGMMRLPKLEDGSMDMDRICAMVDEFVGAGLTYFDTAFVTNPLAESMPGGHMPVLRQATIYARTKAFMGILPEPSCKEMHMERKEAQDRIRKLVARMGVAKIEGDSDYIAFCDEADELREAVKDVEDLDQDLAVLEAATAKLSKQLSFCTLPLN